MKSFCILTLLAVAVTFAPRFSPIHAAETLPEPEAVHGELEGVYFVALPNHPMGGIYIADPKVVQIGRREFLAGRQPGSREGKRETEFSGGTAFIMLKAITTIQEVPEAE